MQGKKGRKKKRQGNVRQESKEKGRKAERYEKLEKKGWGGSVEERKEKYRGEQGSRIKGMGTKGKGKTGE